LIVLEGSFGHSLSFEFFTSEFFDGFEEFLVHFGESEVFFFVVFEVLVESVEGGFEGRVLFLELVDLSVEFFGLVVHGVDGFIGFEDLLEEGFELALF
jgi:hypothetical protein